jgi:hypothetical protein
MLIRLRLCSDSEEQVLRSFRGGGSETRVCLQGVGRLRPLSVLISEVIRRLTQVGVIEAPFSTQICALPEHLLILSYQEVNLRFLLIQTLSFWLQVYSVSIALVAPIDEDDHSEALSDKFPRREMNCEDLRVARHGEVCLNQTIPVDGAVLRKRTGRLWPLHMADEVL